MDTGLAGKNVLITGASRNMGRLAAIQFAKEGANLAICTSTKMKELDEVAAELRTIGVKVHAARCDVANKADVAVFVREAQAALGSIDVAINNAVYRAEGAFLEESDETWERNIAVNLTGPRNICRAVLPGMIARGEGYLLNTVSAAGLLSQIGGAVYSTTKHAAVGLAESLAITHGDQGIKVSILCPQGVDTAMLRAGGSGSPQSLDGVLTPDEVAGHVVEGLAAERFLILPHPEVLTYMQRKTADYDRWLGGMRRLRAKVMGR